MITRRTFIIAASSLMAVPVGAATEHPSIVYMRQVGKDLLGAHRQGTVSAFQRVVQRHADIPGIAEYSLGDYGSKLTPGQRQKYYRGVTNFISRYFAEQSHEFQVAQYELGDATADDRKDVYVDSTVNLLTGQSYNVKWRLSWRGGRYKVIDAKMLGFSLTYMQRSLFTSFIDKRNGNVGDLIVALNR